jgi:hypothetical protein
MLFIVRADVRWFSFDSAQEASFFTAAYTSTTLGASPTVGPVPESAPRREMTAET